jgi:hypothetical protein
MANDWSCHSDEKYKLEDKLGAFAIHCNLPAE